MPVDFQHGFTKALLDPQEPVPSYAVGFEGERVQKRFNVYRNNVISSLMEALAQGFPFVCRLVGEDFFKAMARDYARAHPPLSPVMVYYGADFPEFIASYTAAHSLPYLCDVARLEYARREAYFAKDAVLLSADWATKEEPSTLYGLKLDLHPSLRVIESVYPIYDLWAKYHGELDKALGKNGQTVLVSRPQFEVITRFAPCSAKLFFSFLGKKSLGEAVEATLKKEAQADIHNLITIAFSLTVRRNL